MTLTLLFNQGAEEGVPKYSVEKLNFKPLYGLSGLCYLNKVVFINVR